MIKIILQGKDTKKVKINIYKVICPNCECLFEFEDSDAISIVKERTIDGKLSGRIHCPHCGTSIQFTENTIVRTEEKEIKIKKEKSVTDFFMDKCDAPVDNDYSIETEKLAREIATHSSYTALSSWPECETCPFKPDNTKIVVGDTACTWCKKNQVTCR